MGVGAQKDLGGHQTFARVMTLNFARKAIGFSAQIKVTSKKKNKKKGSALKLKRFFCPNLGDLQEKKKGSSLKLRRFDEY